MKVAVFIDNSNVFKNINKLRRIDNNWTSFYNPLNFSKKLSGNRELVYVGFYCTNPPAYLLKEDKSHIEKYNKTRRYYTKIEGLPLVEVKYGYLQGCKGDMHEKNLDTQLCIDMVKKAAFNEYDVAILVTNDGDYVSAVESVKNDFNKKVEVAFFKRSFSMNLKKNSDITRKLRQSYFDRLDF